MGKTVIRLMALFIMAYCACSCFVGNGFYIDYDQQAIIPEKRFGYINEGGISCVEFENDSTHCIVVLTSSIPVLLPSDLLTDSTLIAYLIGDKKAILTKGKKCRISNLSCGSAIPEDIWVFVDSVGKMRPLINKEF